MAETLNPGLKWTGNS